MVQNVLGFFNKWSVKGDLRHFYIDRQPQTILTVLFYIYFISGSQFATTLQEF